MNLSVDHVPVDIGINDESTPYEERLQTELEAGIEVRVMGISQLADHSELDEAAGDAVSENLRACFDAISVDDLVNIYFWEINQVPLLTTEEEIILAKRIEGGRAAQDALDQESLDSDRRAALLQAAMDGLAAYEHLVRANSRLVVSVAKKYIGRGVPFMDLVQEGNIGLMRAANKFDYRLGNKFSTYATWWIRQGVTRAIADQGRTVRIPVHLVDQIGTLRHTAHRLTQELGHEPSSQELATAMDMPLDRAEQLLQATHAPISLNMAINDTGDSELGDLIEDTDSPAPDTDLAFQMLQVSLADILQDLPPREVYILKMRYGLGGGVPHTLAEAGKKLGVTRERVRQIEAQALRRLRHPARARRLKDFLLD